MRKKCKEIVFEMNDRLYVKRYSPLHSGFRFMQFNILNGWLMNATVISATKFFHNLRTARASKTEIKTNYITKPIQK